MSFSNLQPLCASDMGNQLCRLLLLLLVSTAFAIELLSSYGFSLTVTGRRSYSTSTAKYLTFSVHDPIP